MCPDPLRACPVQAAQRGLVTQLHGIEKQFEFSSRSHLRWRRYGRPLQRRLDGAPLGTRLAWGATDKSGQRELGNFRRTSEIQTGCHGDWRRPGCEHCEHPKQMCEGCRQTGNRGASGHIQTHIVYPRIKSAPLIETGGAQGSDQSRLVPLDSQWLASRRPDRRLEGTRSRPRGPMLFRSHFAKRRSVACPSPPSDAGTLARGGGAASGCRSSAVRHVSATAFDQRPQCGALMGATSAAAA